MIKVSEIFYRKKNDAEWYKREYIVSERLLLYIQSRNVIIDLPIDIS